MPCASLSARPAQSPTEADLACMPSYSVTDREGKVVGTTKCSEQNHNPKEKRIQTQRIFEAEKEKGKATNRFLNTFPKQASRSCWPCGLSARSPGNHPPSSLQLVSAQNKTTIPKKKGFKLKEYSRLRKKRDSNSKNIRG